MFCMNDSGRIGAGCSNGRDEAEKQSGYHRQGQPESQDAVIELEFKRRAVH
jgi:hypothetical protein